MGTWNFQNFKAEFLLNGKRPLIIIIIIITFIIIIIIIIIMIINICKI